MTTSLRRTVWFWMCLVPVVVCGQKVDESPFVGTWATNVPEHGWLVLKVEDNGSGQVSNAALWWFVELLDHGNQARVEGPRLHFDRRSHKGQFIPCLTFELTADKKLRLLAGGVVPSPAPAPFGDLILERNQRMFFWHELTSYRIDASDYNKWHDHGSLIALPRTWTADVAVATARLFAQNDHLLFRALELPCVPTPFLAEAYRWTQEKPTWNEHPEFIVRTIAHNPNTGQSVLEQIWQHPDNPQLWLAVAANPHARTEWGAAVVERIMHSDERVKSRATWDGSGPPELYRRLIQDGARTRSQLASSRRMPTFVYEALLHEYGAETRMELARNEALAPKLLEELASIDDRHLKTSLIHNRSLDPALRTRLVAGIIIAATPGECAALAGDPDAPPEFLARCANDLDPAVRTHVANNPNTDEATLLRLAQDEARETARTARSALGKRFPSALARNPIYLVPLEMLAQDCSPLQKFRQAIERSDLNELVRLSDYLRAKGALESALSTTASDVVKAYRPEVMDFFLAQGFNRYRTALTALAGRCGGNPEWLAYFKAHGAFEGSLPGLAYQAALETERLENLAGLITAQVDVNQPASHGMTALHRAVLGRNGAAVALLVDAGARTDLRDQRGRTALDYAVEGRFVPAIKLLDREKKHATVVKQFTKEYPAAPRNSPFLGRWTNGRDGFYTIVIQLDGEGTGYYSGAVGSLLIAWRTTAKNEVTAFPFDEKGSVATTMPIQLVLDPRTGEVVLNPPKGEKQKLQRMK